MDIAQRVEQQPAPHVVAAIATTIHTHTHPNPRPTPRQQSVRVAEAVWEVTVEV